MYKVSDEIYSNILTEMQDVLCVRDYDCNHYALEEIMDTWEIRKANLLNLFSNHPNWDAERLMIKFDKDFSREIDRGTARDFLVWLAGNTNMSTILLRKNESDYPMCLFDILDGDFTKYTYLQGDEWAVERLELLNTISEDFRFRVGMKATKVMRKICTHFGWDKIMKTETLWNGATREYNEFEREYAKYCDAMYPIKIKRHTCLSLNPIDFLLMSNGNSWRSCHYIDWQDENPGEYSSGTISYMLDEHSFVFYTVDKDFNGKYIEKEEKIQRQMFGYHNNRLLQSRLYPQGNDIGAEEIYADIRSIAQKVIADCCGKPNLWVKRKVYDVVKGDGATCYSDWNHFNDLCSVSVFKDSIEQTDLGYIVMGAYPICISCGSSHSVEDNIDCCHSGETCEHCGCRISGDDIIWVGDYPYCSDCVTWCDCCENYEVDNRITYIPSESRYVCDDCLSEHYARCEECGEYVRIEDGRYIDSEDKYVCYDCADQYYACCAKCGEMFRRYGMHELNGEYVCSDCYEEENQEDEEEAV